MCSSDLIAALNESLAATAVDGARAAFLPRLSATADWQANGGAWNARASGWLVGVTAQVNLFRGFADSARLAEARQAYLRRQAERAEIEGLVRVDLTAARARRDAALAVLTTTEAAVAQAVESHRIVRDRYEAGLADVTSLDRKSTRLNSSH